MTTDQEMALYRQLGYAEATIQALIGLLEKTDYADAASVKIAKGYLSHQERAMTEQPGTDDIAS